MPQLNGEPGLHRLSSWSFPGRCLRSSPTGKLGPAYTGGAIFLQSAELPLIRADTTVHLLLNATDALGWSHSAKGNQADKPNQSTSVPLPTVSSSNF
jgi:hypothetical protein